MTAKCSRLRLRFIVGSTQLWHTEEAYVLLIGVLGLRLGTFIRPLARSFDSVYLSAGFARLGIASFSNRIDLPAKV